eukprot:scaffold622_cov335-Pavlova_lutheri.AAC.16
MDPEDLLATFASLFEASVNGYVRLRENVSPRWPLVNRATSAHHQSHVPNTLFAYTNPHKTVSVKKWNVLEKKSKKPLTSKKCALHQVRRSLFTRCMCIGIGSRSDEATHTTSSSARCNHS